jgi:mRNA interferase RelE/StbE
MDIHLSPAAQEVIARLPKVIRLRIRHVFVELQNWPQVSGVKPLRGQRAGWYRKRTGDYRIISTVSGDTILVEKVGHRRDVYEE